MVTEFVKGQNQWGWYLEARPITDDWIEIYTPLAFNAVLAFMGTAITRGCIVGVSKQVVTNGLSVHREYSDGTRQWKPAIYVLFICK